MGWASGGEIFEVVADAMIEIGADDPTKRRVLGRLAEALRDNDWDTEDDYVNKYRDDDVIMSILRYADEIDGAEEMGTIEYDAERDQWSLWCSQRSDGVLGTRPGTNVGHDELVHLWAAHDRDKHGGSGEIAVDYLFARGSLTGGN